MSRLSNYPAGAASDPRAPYNQDDSAFERLSDWIEGFAKHLKDQGAEHADKICDYDQSYIDEEGCHVVWALGVEHTFRVDEDYCVAAEEIAAMVAEVPNGKPWFTCPQSLASLTLWWCEKTAGENPADSHHTALEWGVECASEVVNSPRKFTAQFLDYLYLKSVGQA